MWCTDTHTGERRIHIHKIKIKAGIQICKRTDGACPSEPELHPLMLSSSSRFL